MSLHLLKVYCIKYKNVITAFMKSIHFKLCKYITIEGTQRMPHTFANETIINKYMKRSAIEFIRTWNNKDRRL